MVTFNTDEFELRDFFQNQLKAILIDFDDTLVDYRSCADKALVDLFRNSGLDMEEYPDSRDFYDGINRRLWPELEKGKTTIDIIRCQRFEEMKEKYPLKGEPCDIDVYYRSRFVFHSKLLPEAMPFLNDMKRRGYKLFVITNGIKETQEARISNLGLVPILDGFVTSEDVGKAKPNPLMMNYALNYLSVDKKEAIVIGDSLHSDILGAKNAGIRSILVKSGVEQKVLEGHHPDLIIENLSDIAKFIGVL